MYAMLESVDAASPRVLEILRVFFPSCSMATHKCLWNWTSSIDDSSPSCRRMRVGQQN